MLRRIVELAHDVTRRLSRHQKYKPQMEQRSVGGGGGMTSSNVKIGAKLSQDVVAVLKSLHFALP